MMATDMCDKYTLVRRGGKIFLVYIFFFLPFLAEAMEGRPYLEFGLGYSTGDFGTPIRTSLYDVSTTLGYVAVNYDFGITAPFLTLSNEFEDQSDHRINGIGDITARGGLALIPETDNGLSLYGALSVKFPTADNSQGLGTGETDYGAFLTLRKRFESVNLSVMGGYIVIGDPADQDYNDIHLLGIGISKVFGKTGLNASFEGRRSIIPGEEHPMDINFGFFHLINSDYSIRSGVSIGLNDGGPDLGVRLGITRWF